MRRMEGSTLLTRRRRRRGTTGRRGAVVDDGTAGIVRPGRKRIEKAKERSLYPVKDRSLLVLLDQRNFQARLFAILIENQVIVLKRIGGHVFVVRRKFVVCHEANEKKEKKKKELTTRIRDSLHILYVILSDIRWMR